MMHQNIPNRVIKMRTIVAFLAILIVTACNHQNLSTVQNSRQTDSSSFDTKNTSSVSFYRSTSQDIPGICISIDSSTEGESYGPFDPAEVKHLLEKTHVRDHLSIAAGLLMVGAGAPTLYLGSSGILGKYFGRYDPLLDHYKSNLRSQFADGIAEVTFQKIPMIDESSKNLDPYKAALARFFHWRQQLSIDIILNNSSLKDKILVQFSLSPLKHPEFYLAIGAGTFVHGLAKLFETRGINPDPDTLINTRIKNFEDELLEVLQQKLAELPTVPGEC